MQSKQQISIERYPKYKDSGVEWIGEIPEGWEVKKLGQILTPVSEKNRPDLKLLSITREKGVIERNLDSKEENHNFIPDDLSNYKVLRKGQFGMNKMKAWQGSYGISKSDGIVSPAYYIFNIPNDFDSDFFHVAIRSHIYVSFFGQSSDGVRIGQWDLSRDRMKSIPIITPPLPEQTAIADFLDDKCEKIDRAVAQKEKLIELLKERKQIGIQSAVTRGLDPDAKMKDSGVEWIGKIPAHWEVVCNFQLLKERNEAGNNDLPILSVSIHTAVSSGELDGDENIRGKIRIEDKSSYKLVEVNDIAFNMMRAWQGAIGCVVTRGMVSPAYIVAAPQTSLSSKFFEYQYRTQIFIQQMDRASKGITDFRKRLYWAEFKRLKTILPPLPEQTAIVAHIEAASAKIDTAISVQERLIEKLKEYKATLINSAVTGKIKVCQ